jgi:hypothetical protein
MLTADLVHVRRRGDLLSIVPFGGVEPERVLVLAAAYLDIARAHIGQERGGFLETCRAVPHAAREKKLATGLLKLVTDNCVFEEATGADPAELRRDLFARAASARRALAPRADFDRAAVIKEAAVAHGLDPDGVERTLYADLPDAHVLRQVDLPGPHVLVNSYADGQTQAVLLRATRVRATVRGADPAAFRALFRKLKFLRLLHVITPLPAEKRRPGGYSIDIDGPFSMFESITRYGLQLALALPALRACGAFTLDADLRWGQARVPLRFALAGTAAPGHDGSRGEPARLPDEVAALLDGLRALGDTVPWDATPSTTLVSLPGLGVCVPDLDLRHRPSGRTVHVEVLGFWSRDAVWKRVELAQAGLPVPIVFAVSKHLRVSEAALPDDVPGALYVYAHVMNPSAVLARAQALLGR